VRPSPVQELRDARLRAAGVRLLLKRDDLLDPEIPGNKWRKVLPNLAAARAEGYRTVLTFGGAYSNHLRATAAAGRRAGLRTVGVVRGDELRDRPLNPSLHRAAGYGMELDFMDRATWRERTSVPVLRALQRRHGPAYVVPEGGSNALGVRGCRAITEELNAQTGGEVDVVCCAVGTGGTLAGLAAALTKRQQAVGFTVLRTAGLPGEIEELQRAAFGGRVGDWRLEDGYHFGGYARSTPELAVFADEVEAAHGLTLDRTYEAKALFGVLDLASAGAFRRGSTLALVLAG
jgi:1-aminocyclopropane-1-carboxylate deaminase/D-cysteine desulfhydrase-like pyridoxal-dependent ACC family enzyme